MKAFGWTHDQYLDTPDLAVEWLLRVDRVYMEAEKREANR